MLRLKKHEKTFFVNRGFITIHLKKRKKIDEILSKEINTSLSTRNNINSYMSQKIVFSSSGSDINNATSSKNCSKFLTPRNNSTSNLMPSIKESIIPKLSSPLIKEKILTPSLLTPSTGSLKKKFPLSSSGCLCELFGFEKPLKPKRKPGYLFLSSLKPKNNIFFRNVRENEALERKRRIIAKKIKLMQVEDNYKEKFKYIKEFSNRVMARLQEEDKQKKVDQEIAYEDKMEDTLKFCQDRVQVYFKKIKNCEEFVNKLRKFFFFYSFKYMVNLYYIRINKFF